MLWTCALFHLVICWAGVSLDVILESETKTLTVLLGEPATFRCNVTGGNWKNYQMSWYKKNENNVLTLVYRLSNNSNENVRGNSKGKIDTSKNQYVLNIQKTTIKDVGTYYCGSDIGGSSWDTRQIFFGTGTKLFVEPQSQPAASPSVFVMKNGTNIACLVKEFYPKDVTITLQSSKKIIEYDPAIDISPGGKYSAVKLGQYGDPDSVTCSVEHNKQTWHSTDFEPKKTIPETTPKPTEYENSTKAEVPVTCKEPQVQPGKVNMMSLSVLGLRMLFAKSVAVNFLLTAKLFFF